MCLKRTRPLIVVVVTCLGLSVSFAGNGDDRGFVFSAEGTSLEYDRSNGLRIGFDSGNEVNGKSKVTGRVELGWQFSGGHGIRVRYWSFDESFPTVAGGGQFLSVDAENFDVEWFKDFKIAEKASIELSAGIRSNEFQELMVEPPNMVDPTLEIRENRVDGEGAVVAAQFSKSFTGHVGLFARIRGALIRGDKFIDNFDAPNALEEENTHINSEFALGAEFYKELANGTLIFRVGGEWQEWDDYSSNFRSTGDRTFEGASDVSFSGFMFSVSMTR